MSYLYQILISDSTYNQLMNIKQNTVDYFDDMIDENTLSVVGNEQSAEFRLIIAKQFIYLYEQNTK
ncbi:hypothetical protein LSAJ156_40011 [Latilactobacillus sakei]|nr:hypothetical protein LSAJ156_40011 [Latilactobacillus sakei]SON67066.1 protein of unknown function [Latilactobacillus sakei]SON72366.1 protein of unknown function [Latilactobacillus sakei]